MAPTSWWGVGAQAVARRCGLEAVWPLPPIRVSLLAVCWGRLYLLVLMAPNFRWGVECLGVARGCLVLYCADAGCPASLP